MKDVQVSFIIPIDKIDQLNFFLRGIGVKSIITISIDEKKEGI